MMNWWWTHGEQLMNWWWTVDELMKNWWWTDDELMMNWWWTDEQTATDWATDCYWSPLNSLKHSNLSPDTTYYYYIPDSTNYKSGANKNTNTNIVRYTGGNFPLGRFFFFWSKALSIYWNGIINTETTGLILKIMIGVEASSCTWILSSSPPTCSIRGICASRWISKASPSFTINRR